MSKPLLILTGGGTAGHVMPHFALLPYFQEKGWSVVYIGSKGMERELVQKQGIPYHQIASGKLRRYFSFENVIDVFRIIWGFLQALLLMIRLRPKAVFSKGGFVSVPVCFAAAVLGVPVVTHESDLTPGLATRLIDKVAKRTLCTFDETQKWIAHAVVVGCPVRREVLSGDRLRGLALCGFQANDERPVVLFMGGSLGAQKINQTLERVFDALKVRFRVIHITGKAKGIGIRDPSYKGFEFVGSELADLLAASDLVVARAGANSIFEFLSLQKPMLLIPLKAGSRGDQIVNAQSFVARGWASVLSEDELDGDRLVRAIEDLKNVATAMRSAQSSFDYRHTYADIMDVLRPFMS